MEAASSSSAATATTGILSNISSSGFTIALTIIGVLAFLAGTAAFIVSYFASGDASILAYSGFGVGIAGVLFLMFGIFGNRLYQASGFGQNTGPIIAVIVVSAIAFLIVFSPVIAGETSSSLDAGATAAIVLAVLIVVGGIVGVLIQKAPGKILTETIRRFSLILYFFLPYSLLLFGPVVDAITVKFQFVPATIVGLTSIFINWAVATFFNNGVAPTSLNATCEIPGLAIFSSNLIPQPMMASLSMLAYIATYISRSTLSGTILNPSISFTNPGGSIWPVWALYGSVAAVYIAGLMGSGCLTVKGILPAVIAPSVYGGIFGILGFEFLAPRYDPGSPAASNRPPVLGGAGSTTPTVGTCAAGSSDGEFICESFENGKLKRTVMTE